VLAGVDAAVGPIYSDGAVERLSRLYRAAGVAIPPTLYASSAAPGTDWTRALIVAPPSCNGSPWLRRFGTVSTGFASGWMRIRGTRRRRSIDRGFVLSDHADWPGLLRAIAESGAEHVWVTHGYRAPMVEWLKEKGLDARPVETRFEGERDEGSEGPEEEES
jgi:putative mRNA 3-end processing factor